jgi:acetyl-CoA C-acetyltransferase
MRGFDMEDVAIIGVGQSNFSRKCGVPVTELCFEAYREAMTGLDVNALQIKASIVCSSAIDKQRSLEGPINDYLGLCPSPTFMVNNACAAGSSGLRIAWSFIKSGLYDVVAVVGVEKMSGLESREVAELMGRAYDISWESSFGVTMPAGYGMHARAHMEKYGTKEEHLAGVRVKNSFYSQMNEKAIFRKSVTLDEVMKSNPVAPPLKMMDCCANADGSSCVIVARGDVAKRVCNKPIWIAGVGAASDSGLSQRKSYTSLSCAKIAAEQAYAMAGVKPADIDVAEVHDCFTIAEILAYEDLGFAKKGEGPKLIENKETYLEGRIPVNVDGGLLCKGHPVGATGGSQIRTIVRQLRGECGPVQVKGAKIGLAHNVGGIGHYANITILRG